jgi:phosphoribosyl-AMP cyclohydrolase
VDQTGPACHTGRRDCFYWKADANNVTIDKTPIIDPKELYKK